MGTKLAACAGVALGLFVAAPSSFAAPPAKKPAAAAPAQGAAPAAPSSAAPKKSGAEASLKAGQKLLDAGKFHEAADKLGESYRLEPKTGTLLVLATAHDKEGRTATAWNEYKQVLTESTKAGNKKRAETARTRIADVYKKLSYVKLDPGQSNATDVEIDGKIIDKSAWGTPQPFDPGPHDVKVSASGGRTKTISMTLQPGPVTQPLALPTLEGGDATPPVAVATTTPNEPANTTPPPSTDSHDDSMKDTGTTPPPKKSGSTMRTVGYVLGGVGIVGVGIGSYFGVVALGNKKTVDAHCGAAGAAGGSSSLTSTAVPCDAQGFQAQKDAHTNGTISTIGIAAGAAVLVTGVVLVILGRGSSEKKSALRLTPTIPVVGSGYGVELGGAF